MTQDTPQSRSRRSAGLAVKHGLYVAALARWQATQGLEDAGHWQIEATAPVAHPTRSEAVKDAMEWLGTFEPDQCPVIVANIITN